MMASKRMPGWTAGLAAFLLAALLADLAIERPTPERNQDATRVPGLGAEEAGFLPEKLLEAGKPGPTRNAGKTGRAQLMRAPKRFPTPSSRNVGGRESAASSVFPSFNGGPPNLFRFVNPGICALWECWPDPAGAPRLTALTVQGAENLLYPPFDPDRQHYALKKGPTDRLVLTAEAAGPDLMIGLNGGPVRHGSIEVDLSSLPGGADVVVEVARADAGRRRCCRTSPARKYVLRYLPEDFPDVQVTQKEDGVTEDLIFAAPRYVWEGAFVSYLTVLDNFGVPRYYRRIEGTALDFKLHPNGLTSYQLRLDRNEFGLFDSVVILMDARFREIGVLRTVGLTQTDSHDFAITPEGNYLFISYNSTRRDMTDFGLAADEIVGDSVIQEVTPDGEVAFQWNSWDHIDLSDCLDTGFRRFPADYAHLNSLHLTPDGDLIASFRGCAQVLKIDRPTGEVLWQLGGRQSDFRIMGDPFGEFCGQHTASELPNGNILMFDNGGFCRGDREEVFGQFSRIVEYRLEAASGSAHFVRDHSLGSDVYTRAQGSAQPLENGNVLISWGRGPDTSITEIDPDGSQRLAMEMRVEGEIAVTYRAYKYPGYKALFNQLFD